MTYPAGHVGAKALSEIPPAHITPTGHMKLNVSSVPIPLLGQYAPAGQSLHY